MALLDPLDCGYGGRPEHAMREIVLDTETTGLDPADGHRVLDLLL